MPKSVHSERHRERLSAIKKQNFKTLEELWPAFAAVKNDISKWGDEVEYLVLHVDHKARELRPSPRSLEILHTLKLLYPDGPFDAEAFNYMLESQPRRPYGNSLRDLARVENDMRDRRRMIANSLCKDERVQTLTNIAMLGSSRLKMNTKALVTDKQRYQNMMDNIPKRASDTDHNYGLELQSFSPSPDHKATPVRASEPIDGWGGCGLQVTFSADNLQQACRLHDQLIPLGPLMLALSAATPIYKGRLVATDTRWEALCGAGDDRTSSEKSYLCPRAGCAPTYLEESSAAQQLNNKYPKPSNVRMQKLQEHGLSATLAAYFTHALERDPIIVSTSIPDELDTSSSAHDARVKLLDVQLSTWWPHVRLKLPVLSTNGASLPWRVEFRPMEIQPSDMENAALIVAMRILQQTIQHFGLDLRIALSAVEEFRVRPMSPEDNSAPMFDGWASLDVIFNGGKDGAGRTWLGLLPVARDCLAQRGISKMSDADQEKISGSLGLLAARASGRLETPAKWMRRFVAENSPGGLGGEEITPQLYYEMIVALTK